METQLKHHDQTDGGKTVLFTEMELAARWYTSVKTLQSNRLRGMGCPFIKIGRLVRYSSDAIERFEIVNTFASTTEADHG